MDVVVVGKRKGFSGRDHFSRCFQSRARYGESNMTTLFLNARPHARSNVQAQGIQNTVRQRGIHVNVLSKVHAHCRACRLFVWFSELLSRRSSWITAWGKSRTFTAREAINDRRLTAKASGLTPLSIMPMHVASVSLSSCVFNSCEISYRTVCSVE